MTGFNTILMMIRDSGLLFWGHPVCSTTNRPQSSSCVLARCHYCRRLAPNTSLPPVCHCDIAANPATLGYDATSRSSNNLVTAYHVTKALACSCSWRNGHCLKPTRGVGPQRVIVHSLHQTKDTHHVV